MDKVYQVPFRAAARHGHEMTELGQPDRSGWVQASCLGCGDSLMVNDNGDARGRALYRDCSAAKAQASAPVPALASA